MKKDPIDALLDAYVTLMPKTAYLMLNKERYDEATAAIKEICEMAQLYDKDAKFDIHKDDLVGTSLNLSITSDLFVIDMIDKFCDSLRVANTFEVNPLTNGKISISMTFQNVYIPAPAYGTPEAIEHNKKCK